VSAWVFVRTFRAYSRLLDFGNGCQIDMVSFTILNLASFPFFNVYNYNTNGQILLLDDSVDQAFMFYLNTWVHYTAINRNGTYFFYFDGKLVGEKINQISPGISNRTLNYIGRSNCWMHGDNDVDGVFDEIRIYNRALEQNEIFDIMKV
jgi:hypothetical protein